MIHWGAGGSNSALGKPPQAVRSGRYGEYQGSLLRHLENASSARLLRTGLGDAELKVAIIRRLVELAADGTTNPEELTAQVLGDRPLR